MLLIAWLLVLGCESAMPAYSKLAWATRAGGRGEDSAAAICEDGVGGSLVTGFFENTTTFGTTTLQTGHRDAFVMHVTSAGSVDWAIGTQSAGSGWARGYGIVSDGAGGALVAGEFQGTISFHVSAWKMLVPRQIWVPTLESSLTSRGRASSAFIMHVTLDGTIDWAVQVDGDLGTTGRAIASDGSGGALVAGSFWGSATFGSTVLTNRSDTEPTAFVMSVSHAGRIRWALQIGDCLPDLDAPCNPTAGSACASCEAEATAIASDGAGGAFVTGRVLGAWFNTTSPANSSDTTEPESRSLDDVFVVRVTASGFINWGVQAGGRSVTKGYGIAPDGSGGALVVGTFCGDATFGSTKLRGSSRHPWFLDILDTFVMHVTALGTIEWAVPANVVEGYAITSDGRGGALVTGMFTGQATFSSTLLTSTSDGWDTGGAAGGDETVSYASGNLFVMHVTSAGVISWAFATEGNAHATSTSIAFDESHHGHALLTGQFKGEFEWGFTFQFAGELEWVAGELEWGWGQQGLHSQGEGTDIFVACLGLPVRVPLSTPPTLSLPPSSPPQKLLPPSPLPPLSPSPSTPLYRSPVLNQQESSSHTVEWWLSCLAVACAVILVAGLCACLHWSRRRAENFRASRDRAHLDMQMLTHRLGLQHDQSEPRAPSESSPPSIPPAPPSSRGTRSRSSRGGPGSAAESTSRGSGGSVVSCDMHGTDPFDDVYHKTLSSVFRATSWEAARASLQPILLINMPAPSADRFEGYVRQLYVLARCHLKMPPEQSFGKLREVMEAIGRDCEIGDGHPSAPLVRGLRRFFEEMILPNGALEHIVVNDFTTPADEVGALLDSFRWVHNARRQHVYQILRKILVAMATFRATVANLEGTMSHEQADRSICDAHERLIQAVDCVLQQHALAADPTLAMKERLWNAVAKVAVAHSEEIRALRRRGVGLSLLGMPLSAESLSGSPRDVGLALASSLMSATVAASAAAGGSSKDLVAAAAIPIPKKDALFPRERRSAGSSSSAPPPSVPAAPPPIIEPSNLESSADEHKTKQLAAAKAHLERCEARAAAEKAAEKEGAAARKRRAEKARAVRAEAPERPYTQSGPSHAGRSPACDPAPSAEEQARRLADKEASIERQRAHQAELDAKEVARVEQLVGQLRMRDVGESIAKGDE